MRIGNKIRTTFCALAILVSVLISPLTVYAAGDLEAPTVTAEILGDVLRVEASDNDSGVESIFINEHRFNYRVDGVLEVNINDYHGGAEYIDIYATDFAGNRSEVIQLGNPYYVVPEPEDTEAEPEDDPSDSELEELPEEQLPFTPDGTGTVVDNVMEQNGKEFFSITTEAGNVFYLIVDRHRDSDNVYLLNAVTEDDLMALSEESDSSQDEIPIPTPIPEPTEEKEPEPTPVPEPIPEEPEKSSNGSLIFIVIAALLAGGAGYYFKVVKPKQQTGLQPDDDFFTEDMEYEDDPENDEESEGEESEEDDYEEYPYEQDETEDDETE